MALIINQTPPDGASAHFPLWHAVNTDLYFDPTLKVVFEVFIGGVLMYTAKIPPPPNLGLNAFFNAAPVVRDYLTKYFAPANAFHCINTNAIYVEYQIKYGEEWTPSSGIVTGSYQQATSTHKVYNAYPEYFQDGSIIAVPQAGNILLTDRDLTQTYLHPDYNFLYSYLRGSTTAAYVSFAFFRNINGITSGGLTYPGGNITSANLNKLSVFRISKAIADLTAPGAFSSTTHDVFIEVGNGTVLDNKSFVAKVWCHPKYTPVAVHFLNRYGGYETMIFGLVNKREVEFQREYYSPDEFVKQSIPFIIPAPDPSVFVGTSTNFKSTTKVYNPMKVQRSTMHKLTYNLTSDFVTEKNYTWLKQLLASPEIYIEQNAYFYPVTVTNSRWSEKKTVSDKMFNLDLNVEAFSNVYSQFQ